MRVGSLFSGIGGIELGLERAGGFETVWFVENDPHAQAVLRKNWPTAKIYEDVTTVDFSCVPRVDMLTGGFPCQDISNAGKRVGISGSRSSLWKDYLRAIGNLQPRIVFIENVAALTGRGLDTVLIDLATLGYDAEWHCVPAAAVGAPHRRDRILIIAYTDGGRINREQRSESISEERRNSELANTHGDGIQRNQFSVSDTEEWKRSEQGSIRSRCIGCSNEDVENANCRHDESWIGERHSSGLSGQEQASNAEQRGTRNRGQWTIEPELGRVAHGIPRRVHRIKQLGNAVVPQWAEAVARTIKAFEGDR